MRERGVRRLVLQVGKALLIYMSDGLFTTVYFILVHSISHHTLGAIRYHRHIITISSRSMIDRYSDTECSVGILSQQYILLWCAVLCSGTHDVPGYDLGYQLTSWEL